MLLISIKMEEKLTTTFMELFCEKNSDGTKNLRLKGKDLWQRIGARLKDSDMMRVSYFLHQRLDIVKLDLCYNDVGDVGIDILVNTYLSEPNNLEYLNLAGCNITWEGIKHLCSASDTLKLKSLRLNGNKLGTKGGKYVSALLEDSTTLELIDLGDSDQTLASVQYFMAVLREDIGANKTLTVLDLSRIIPYSEFYQYDPGHMAENLGEMLKMNSTLKELHVQKCEFQSFDIELLLIGLSRNKTLLMLDLGYNRIGVRGIHLLSEWLKTRPPLLALNVAGNSIIDDGASYLSFGLPCSRVRLLDLSDNKIKDNGMIDLLNSIKKPYMLRVFYIWGNNFTQKTLKIIQRMLLSGVLDQNNLDIKLYTVDNVICHAFNLVNHYKHRYYCVMDHGCPVELKIKKNKLEKPGAQPRALVKFEYYDRFPAVDESLPPILKTCKPSKTFKPDKN